MSRMTLSIIALLLCGVVSANAQEPQQTKVTNQQSWDDHYSGLTSTKRRSRKKRRTATYHGNKVGQKRWTGGPRPSISALKPPVVTFRSGYAKGTIVIDTKGRRLFYVLSTTQAYRYPISVGRIGFQWSGSSAISAKRNWPDWRPPASMRKREPHLPVVMTGGLHNPLGAKALYLWLVDLSHSWHE